MKVMLLFICLLAACQSKSPHLDKEQKMHNMGKVADMPRSIYRNQFDTLKQKKSMAIIKGVFIREGGGDKYILDTIEVNEVIQNKTSFRFGKVVTVARYNWSNPLPAGKVCIIYLTAYPYGNQSFDSNLGWMYIDADAETSSL